MSNEIKIPKYIEDKLKRASDYAAKSSRLIIEFEQWVRETISDDFDFDVLRASRFADGENGIDKQTEALTEIEYGNAVDTKELERVLNYWKDYWGE